MIRLLRATELGVDGVVAALARPQADAAPELSARVAAIMDEVRQHGDPALLERPMLQEVLAKHKIPYTAFKFAENTGQMAPIREQAGTFADSIKLWSAT